MNDFNGKVWVKCRRTHSEVFRKDDVERYFDLTTTGTIQEDGDNKHFNANFKKFEYFSIQPVFRFNEKGDNKLTDKDDELYFAIYALDRDSDPKFVKYVYCGYATTKRLVFKFM
jgi:hypothetical protein